MDDAKTRMPFDHCKGSLNFSRRRATPLKGNSRVFFPRKVKNFDTEAKLEMYRVESLAVFRQFLREKCGKFGRQKSNLSKCQLKGLLSLKTRIKNGEIAVIPTDKTGNFTRIDKKLLNHIS